MHYSITVTFIRYCVVSCCIYC